MLETPIASLPRTRPVTIARLKSLGITTFGDLLEYLPHRFEDYSVVSPISSVQEGETVTVKGFVESAKTLYLRRGMTIQKVTIADDTGTLTASWYNQPYIVRNLKTGGIVSLSGVVKVFQKKLTLEVKSYESLAQMTSETTHTGRLVAVYPQKYGLSSRILREKIAYAFSEVEAAIPEILPKEIIAKNRLLSREESMRSIHFPHTIQDFEKAKERLAFEELFVLQTAASIVHRAWKKDTVGHKLEVSPHKKQIAALIKSLPFTLTAAQKRSVDEILSDMSKKAPMNRFLQGEVGSGKTVVAATAAYVAALNGFKTLIMAPTEILANQHYVTLTTLFKDHNLSVAIKTSSRKEGSPTADIIVGTHALLHQKKGFAKVGLVVVDEQHRFGVKQRTALKDAGLNPHLLTMTATPIPRTLALTVYGQLEVSILDQMPASRLPVRTYLVPPHKREAAYEWIKKKVAAGQQVFIVCPFIEESVNETMKSVRAATVEYERLTRDIFSRARCILLHGKIPSLQKKAIMEDFKSHKYDILVTTPVVEVGIDIPRATVMLIEGAERYGLAQLHQLRGRVGRGTVQSHCLVFTSDDAKVAGSRLAFFAKTHSGMELAEYDLKYRGAGEIYGTMQHGAGLLKVASLGDTAMVKNVQAQVTAFLAKDNIDHYKDLKAKVNAMELEFIGPN